MKFIFVIAARNKRIRKNAKLRTSGFGSFDIEWLDHYQLTTIFFRLRHVERTDRRTPNGTAYMVFVILFCKRTTLVSCFLFVKPVVFFFFFRYGFACVFQFRFEYVPCDMRI